MAPSIRGEEGLGRQPVRNMPGRNRFAVKKALHLFTADIPETGRLFFGFDALCNDPKIHAATKVDNRFRDCGIDSA